MSEQEKIFLKNLISSEDFESRIDELEHFLYAREKASYQSGYRDGYSDGLYSQKIELLCN